MKVALVHDWLVTKGGAENVLEELIHTYNNADIYTLLSNPTIFSQMSIDDYKVKNSFLQKIPYITKIYRNIPNLFPLAIESFDLSNYDLVISSSHAVAKGVLTNAKTCHISYMHTPMRYIWDLTFDYINNAHVPFLVKCYMQLVFHYMRMWDIQSSFRPDFIVANSHFIKRRIQKTYRRHAHVIYPPVSLSDTVYTNKENYYVTASRHVPYKNIPLIAEAFAQMPDKKLIILGDGPDAKKVEKICAKTKNIDYLGYQPNAILHETIAKAKAFVFAAEEDFGILPVEAQGFGTPVIAYGVGGVKETVIPHKTGLFFQEQNVDSIKQSIREFESIEDTFDYHAIAQHSQQFSTQRFHQEFDAYVNKCLEQFIK